MVRSEWGRRPFYNNPSYITFKGKRYAELPPGWADGVSASELKRTTRWTQVLNDEGELQLERIPEARKTKQPPFRPFKEEGDGNDSNIS